MSFVNAFFLFGMIAAAIPVLLHFVRKMNAKKVSFGSLMFLAPTDEQIVKKRKLQDILLMTVRAGIVGLLALVFARPFVEEVAVPFFKP